MKLGDRSRRAIRSARSLKTISRTQSARPNSKLKDAEPKTWSSRGTSRKSRKRRPSRSIEYSRAIQEAQATVARQIEDRREHRRGRRPASRQKYLGDIELLESREKLYLIKDDLNKGKSRLAELELEWIKGENARRHAQLERRLKIQQLKTKLELDRDKLVRTSQVVSQVHGRVAQVLSANGELVHEGAPVVLLAWPQGANTEPR